MLVLGCQKVDPNITAKDVVGKGNYTECLFTSSKKTQDTFAFFRDVNSNDK